jgi:hypothetical protein
MCPLFAARTIALCVSPRRDLAGSEHSSSDLRDVLVHPCFAAYDKGSLRSGRGRELSCFPFFIREQSRTSGISHLPLAGINSFIIEEDGSIFSINK